MNKKNLLLTISLVSVMALSCIGLKNVFADPLFEASGVASPNTTTTTQTTYTFTLTPTTAIPNGSSIVLSLPSDFSGGFSSLVDADISVSGTNITSTTETIDDTNLQITSTLTTSADVTTQITITIGDAAGGLNDLTNPSDAGLYGINIDTFNSSSQLLDHGAAFVEIDASSPITASVTESIVMTLSNSQLHFYADPSVSAGQDKSKSTTLNVSSNATNGYVIKGKLDNSNGEAVLRNGSAYVSSSSYASASGNDNYFGYTARNDGTGSTNDAENAFAATDTTLKADGANNLGLGTTTSSQDHTVNYDFNIDYTTSAGEYTGTIYYTISPSF